MIPPLSHDLPTRHGETAAAAGPTPCSSFLPTTRTYSTCWMPLEGMIQDWLDVGREVILATALAAAGAALFALSHEKRALGCYSQGWHDCWQQATQQAQEAFQQTGQHLSAAAQQWSLAVSLLDTLSREQQQAVPADELARIRALAQTARAQQARLCALAEEIRADLAAAAQQQEGMPWPSA